MTELREALNQRLIADGAMGTQLFALGLKGDCPEVWNVRKPEVVTGIHRSYVDAGAQLILTNTFGATRWKLDRAGHAEDQERFCRAAVESARKATEGRAAYVLGDVGPTGELPQPFGTRTLDEFEDAFAEQIAFLVAAGVHGILIESMVNSAEAAAGVRAARRTCDLPVFASVTYQAGKAGYRTLMGETVGQATEAVLGAGADVVGSNCGLGAAQMVDVVPEVRAASSGPILAKPNAGQPELVAGETVFNEDPETWAAKAPELARAGATIIGGCCGTTPDYIACARQRLT